MTGAMNGRGFSWETRFMDLDYERSKAVITENNRIYRIFYDEDGTEVYRTRPVRLPRNEITHIPGQSEDPRAYHREYYRRVRRYRDGVERPRVTDEGERLGKSQ